MTPVKDAMAHLQPLPFTLSTGQTLVAWLVEHRRHTGLDALRAREEYQHFLALALTTPEGQATLPGPHIAELWQAHRADTAAYSAFTAALGSDRLAHAHPRRSLALDPAWPQTRARYRAAFGSPPTDWWPSRSLIWAWLVVNLLFALWLGILLWVWITDAPQPSDVWRLFGNLMFLTIFRSGKRHLRPFAPSLLRPTLAPSAAP